MIIGVTGKIGSGKSYICNVLNEYCKTNGIPSIIYDCDHQVRSLLKNDRTFNRIITLHYGGEITFEKIFSNYNYWAVYVQPIINEIVKRDFLIKQRDFKVVFLESAILGGTCLELLCDNILYVNESYDVRLQRVLNRNKTEDYFRKIDASQQSVPIRYTTNIEDIINQISTIQKSQRVNTSKQGVPIRYTTKIEDIIHEISTK